jgi:hypothetical protein
MFFNISPSLICATVGLGKNTKLTSMNGAIDFNVYSKSLVV